MKYWMFWAGSLVAMVLAVLMASPAFAQEPEFCWRDTTTRGVGTVPTSCGPGREMIGLLCYSQCPANMKRVGFDCHSVCPDGMRDDGLFCRAEEYGRGWGYGYQADDWFSNAGMFRRCEADHGQGNCEQWGAVVYPKCAPGYEAFGSNICRPKVPDCAALGMNPGIDLSCAKKITIGDPTVGVCGPGEQMDAGLCYTSCPKGYTGVGPVCWAQAPQGWVECGMGAAKDDKTCAFAIGGQVAAVGEMALFVASLGSSSSATAGAKTADSAGKLAKLKQTFEAMKAKFNLLRQTYPAIDKAVKIADAGVDIAKGVGNAVSSGNKARVGIDTALNAVTEEDMARAAAQIAAILDPSGVSGTIAAYTYPKCSKYGFLYELAHGKPTQQSTTSYEGVPSLAVDGKIVEDRTTSHTGSEQNAWWQVDLEDSHTIETITIWNRVDCCQDRLSDFLVFVSESDMAGRSLDNLMYDTTVWSYRVSGQAPAKLDIPVNTPGRYVRIQLTGQNYLSLAEVQVWGR